MFSVSDSHGVLGLGGSCLVTDRHYGVTITPHVSIQKQAISEALGITTSTNKQEVEMLPHVAESSLGFLIYNSAVWAEGQLPTLSTNGDGLPHQAPMSVEV